MAYQSASKEMRSLSTKQAGTCTLLSEAEYKAEYPKLLVWAIKKYPFGSRSWVQYQGELKFWNAYLREEFGDFQGDDPDPMESAYAEVGQVELEIVEDYVPIKRSSSLDSRPRTSSTMSTSNNLNKTPPAASPPITSSLTRSGVNRSQFLERGVILPSSRSLAGHMKTHTGEKSRTSPNSNNRPSTIVATPPPPSSFIKPAVSAIDLSPTTTASQGLYKCQECGLVHMRTHSEGRPFECQQCHQKFKLAHHLTQHVKVHIREKPFRCKEYEMSFAAFSDLHGHKKSAKHLQKLQERQHSKMDDPAAPAQLISPSPVAPEVSHMLTSMYVFTPSKLSEIEEQIRGTTPTKSPTPVARKGQQNTANATRETSTRINSTQTKGSMNKASTTTAASPTTGLHEGILESPLPKVSPKTLLRGRPLSRTLVTSSSVSPSLDSLAFHPPPQV